MIVLEGIWRSKLHTHVTGKIKIRMEYADDAIKLTDNLYEEMYGIVNIKYDDDKYNYMIGNQTFFINCTISKGEATTVDEKNIQIDRFFIRQFKLSTETYYTLQLSRYNNDLLNGFYTSIYPGDCGDILNMTMTIEPTYDRSYESIAKQLTQ